ncbi:MAG: HypC/HybG/HupF family hydrogenase formation chaperone [Candidatus Ranarchaeia archaeon]
MCLGIPGRVLEINADKAVIDFGSGTSREVNIALVEVNKGDYVIVHAGFAIEVMDEESAKETIETWNEYLKYQETERK